MADKNKNNYLWIGIAVVAVIIIVIFFMNNSGISKINTNTISITDFKYVEHENDGPLYYVDSSGLWPGKIVFTSQFNIDVGNIEGLYIYLFNEEGEKLFLREPSGYGFENKLKKGENNVVFSFPGDSLYKSTDIKICLSKKDYPIYDKATYNQYIDKLSCISKNLRAISFNLEITQSPDTLNLQKGKGGNVVLRITNIGEDTAPSILNFDNANNFYVRQQNTKNNLWLESGESFEYIFEVSSSNDVEVGYHEINGYLDGVYVDKFGFKKDSKIKVNVI
ncbi:hypothetical protein J4225_05130 [Candidatus Pacearchaeota archaeon]|nr:hypothetical protein [Candidatus Pacearchaeota archaeon]